MANAKNLNSSQPSANEKLKKAMNLVKEVRDEKIHDAEETLSSQLRQGRHKVMEYAESAQEQFEETREMAEKRITTHPFAYVGGAALGGLLLGYLFGRKG